MNKRYTTLHPSAEEYRTRANLLRRSIGPKTDAEQRDTLMELARDFEERAAALEQMRIKGRL
jgi:hypothetical protein